MKKSFIKKAGVLVALSLLCSAAFARSESLDGRAGSAPSLRDAPKSKPLFPFLGSNNNSKSGKGASTGSSASSGSNASKGGAYRGDLQMHLTFGGGSATPILKTSSSGGYYRNIRASDPYGYSSYDYGNSNSKKDSDGGLAMGMFGLSNHNLFRIVSFSIFELSAGFMEDFYFGGGTGFSLETMIGGSVGFGIGNAVMLQIGIGLNCGYGFVPLTSGSTSSRGWFDDGGIGFGFDMDLKFFPNANFNPMIGIRWGSIEGYDAKLETFKFYLGGGWRR